MHKDKLAAYIETGLSTLTTNYSQIKQMAYGPGVFTFVGVYFGYSAKQLLPVSILMCVLYLATVLAVSIIYKRKDTITNRLWFMALIGSNWFIQLTFMALLVLLLSKRFYLSSLLVLLFPLVPPVATCLYMSARLTKKTDGK